MDEQIDMADYVADIMDKHYDKVSGRAASLTPGAPQIKREGAAGALLDERGTTHGDYSDGARTIQGLKSFFHRHAGWNKLDDCQKETFDMYAVKFGRLLCGDVNFKDSWADIEGYTRLIVERLK